MINWPINYDLSWTLAGSVEYDGIGLHTGERSKVRLGPSLQQGFWLGWIDEPKRPLIRLHPAYVAATMLCTSLRIGHRHLYTVEHLLAALAGCGVTHAEIRVQGSEIPLLDGSALPWVEAIANIGLQQLGPRSKLNLPKLPYTLRRDQSFVVMLPSEQLQLSAAVDFPQAAIGQQFISFDLTPQLFVDEIAPARTFGFREQIEQLKSADLIKGGALDNALVCDGSRWLNPPLRFADEPVRHKLLDLLGDLALVGLPQAHVFAYRGSHSLHTAFTAAIAQQQTINAVAA